MCPCKQRALYLSEALVIYITPPPKKKTHPCMHMLPIIMFNLLSFKMLFKKVQGKNIKRY